MPQFDVIIYPCLLVTIGFPLCAVPLMWRFPALTVMPRLASPRFPVVHRITVVLSTPILRIVFIFINLFINTFAKCFKDSIVLSTVDVSCFGVLIIFIVIGTLVILERLCFLQLSCSIYSIIQHFVVVPVICLPLSMCSVLQELVFPEGVPLLLFAILFALFAFVFLISCFCCLYLQLPFQSIIAVR